MQSAPVVMPQIPLGIDLVSHALLQHLGFGEATVQLALPYLHVVAADMKGPAGGRHQRHLAEVVAKGREQLLSQPGGTQHPLALRAVGDDNFRFGIGHDESARVTG